MATSSSYVWHYDLVDFPITTDERNDWRACVSTGKSMSVADVAHEVASERTDMREDTLVLAMKLMEAKVRQLVCQGYTVVTDNALFQPVITGTFDATTGKAHEAKNRPVCSVRPSKTLRQQVAGVSLEFSGNVQRSGGCYISLVKDVTTGATDGSITPGGPIIVTGRRIKCVGEGGGTGVVRFVQLDEAGELSDSVLSASAIAENYPKRLVVLCPSALVTGESYVLQILSHYTGGARLLTGERVITSSPLVAL